jgi:hypothetical protein
MGNSNSSKISKDVKEERASKKKELIHNRVSEINSIQESVIKNNINDMDAIKQAVILGEVAKKQLEKGGSSLNKADLIAIIAKLDPLSLTRLDELQKLTIQDLNSLIRSNIYDYSQSRSVEITDTYQRPAEISRNTYSVGDANYASTGTYTAVSTGSNTGSNTVISTGSSTISSKPLKITDAVNTSTNTVLTTGSSKPLKIMDVASTGTSKPLKIMDAVKPQKPLRIMDSVNQTYSNELVVHSNNGNKQIVVR